jgi:GNAT superfamily N-acetyltransferase
MGGKQTFVRNAETSRLACKLQATNSIPMHRTTITTGHAALAQRQAILEHLSIFNSSQAAPAEAQSLCIAITDANGAVLGGLYATALYDWLAIELIFIPEESRGRGLGSGLVAQAEEQAGAWGCIGAWLDTFSFQARGFYEKLGYSLAGTIPDHPIGGARYFMTKRWA